MRRLQFLAFIIVLFSLNWIHADDLRLTYSPIANKFHLMDQVSESMTDFFLIPEYKSSWIETYGLSDEDQAFLGQYQQLRKKYQNPNLLTPTFVGKKSGLFAPHPEEVQDVIADSFYTSEALEEAFQKISSHLTQEEVQLIKNFFDHFSEKINKMQEFTPSSLEKILTYFNEQLDGKQASQHLANIALFYQSASRNFKSIRVLLASANGNSFNGRCCGDHLQIIIPIDRLPIENEELMKYLTSVIVHEAIHHVSGTASHEQKQKLTSHFIGKVGSIGDMHFLNVIEEPLVMASQMLFMKNAYPEVYSKDAPWFNHPLASKYLSLLEVYIDKGKSIDTNFIENCANFYTERNYNEE
jgi:hypothetical protein